MGQFSLIPVQQVENISKEEFKKEFFQKGQPVVIKNLTHNWQAYKKWNLDYIQSQAADIEIPLYNNKPATGKQSVYAPVAKMPLKDYVEIIKNRPTDLRIFFFNILDHMPQMINDFEYPDIGLKFFKRLPALFFGGSQSKVFMHYDIDLPDSLHFHFHGRKEVVLFAPDQTKYLYKVPYSIHNLECIDMDFPDFEKFPALNHASGYRAYLEHGDTLYMPSGYWHYIKYLNGGFSMTLRALPRRPKKFLKMLHNVFIIRHFDNLMRRIYGQKWLDYKNKLCRIRTNRALEKKNGKSQ